MAQEESAELDPAAEAKRIVSGYINKLGWARESRRMIENQLISFAAKEDKLRQAEDLVLSADEFFGGEVDIWRHDRSAKARKVLSEILRMLLNRSDLTFFSKKMRERLKEELLQ